MRKNLKKILFISHEASLSGAPILALSVLKMLKENKNYSVDVMLLRGGPLYEDFAKLSDQKIIVASYYNQSLSFIKRVVKKLESLLIRRTETKEKTIEKITNRLLTEKYDLVYANTAETLLWTFPFFRKSIPTIVAFHELSFAIQHSYTTQFLKENISDVSMIIAGSAAVAQNLIKSYDANPHKIMTIHSFVDEIISITKEPIEIKKELNIKSDELILGIASSQELRKGTDLVPMLVKKIAEKTEIPFKFLNMGGNEEKSAVIASKLDAEKLGVKDKIIYIDHNKTPNNYINIFDIFLLLSREDPFPLVMLTAAKLEKPIIAFEQSGGAVEFLENDYGILVPYLDLDRMATEIVRLLENSSDRERYGKKIKIRVEKDYTSGRLTNEILEVIKNRIN